MPNRNNTQTKAKGGALNLKVIALLNGSIALAFRPKSNEYKKVILKQNKKAYFPNFIILSFFSLITFCLIPMNIANLFSNSWSAPKGQSHPQNNALPQIGIDISAANPIITIAGSAKNDEKPFPSNNA
jgi:hypothetical protein